MRAQTTYLLEPADVARVLGLTSASVRALERTGALTCAATTPRGVRLFTPEAVEALRQQRAQRHPARSAVR